MLMVLVITALCASLAIVVVSLCVMADQCGPNDDDPDTEGDGFADRLTFVSGFD